MYISVAVLIGLMFLIITNVTSCSAVFLQNVITYTGTSYLSSDQAIREAELIFRIEDTDSHRFVPGAEEYIIESFKWLGIQFDELPTIFFKGLFECHWCF